MNRSPLPRSLGEAFTVRSAVDAGVSPSRLRASDLERPFHGVYRIRSVPDDAITSALEHLERAKLYALRMPAGAFFVGVTAAVVWDVPLPTSVWQVKIPDARPAPRPLDVGVFAPHRAPRGKGVAGHEVRPLLVTIRHAPASGLVLSSPASTWATLGAVLEHPYDLIAAGDALVKAPRHRNDPDALATRAELAAAVSAGRRVGLPALRSAWGRVRTGSASRPETWVRLTLVDAGLAEPELNHPVHDERGTFIGFVDLAYPQLKIAIEYEGIQHLTDPEQWARDIDRYDRLAQAGWRVIRVTKSDVFAHPDVLVDRVRWAVRSRA